MKNWLLDWGRRHFGAQQEKKIEGAVKVQQSTQGPVIAHITSRDNEELLREQTESLRGFRRDRGSY
jgi:hypothetical protein